MELRCCGSVESSDHTFHSPLLMLRFIFWAHSLTSPHSHGGSYARLPEICTPVCVFVYVCCTPLPNVFAFTPASIHIYTEKKAALAFEGSDKMGSFLKKLANASGEHSPSSK